MVVLKCIDSATSSPVKPFGEEHHRLLSCTVFKSRISEETVNASLPSIYDTFLQKSLAPTFTPKIQKTPFVC